MAVSTLTSRKATPLALTRENLRGVLRTDVYGLATWLGYTDMTETFHRPMADFMRRGDYLRNLYMVPRGYFKTSLSIARLIQLVLNRPDIRILLASNKAENAEAVLAEIKGHLLNETLIWLFPEVLFKDPQKQSDVWTTSRIAVKTTKRRREPTITTIGLHGELTGRHYDHGTFDDLVGLENSQTREERLKTIAWWQAAQSLLDPGSTEDILGTPWDWDDLYAWLLTQKAKQGMPLGVYKKSCWEPCAPEVLGAAEVPGFGWVRATFPERFPVPELVRIKKEIGSIRFSSQYLLDPVDEETAVFPRSQAVIWPRHKMPDHTAGMWLVMSVDPAESQKGWADYTAFAVVGFDHENRMFVYHLDRGRWTETQLIREVYAWFNRYQGVTTIGIEAIAFQKYLLHLFTAEGERRGQYLPIFKLARDTKRTKTDRIRVLQPLWESGSIILADDLLKLDEFLSEAARFRLYKESAHDDMLDALADCFQLRVRPPAVETAPRLSDPELAERGAAEQTIQDERATRGLTALDGASLRVTRLSRQARAQDEAERQMVALGAGNDELFTTAGW